MVLAKYQHMSILEFILIIKQHILILCKKATHVIKLGFVRVSEVFRKNKKGGCYHPRRKHHMITPDDNNSYR
jgi:hypothetical protein